MVGPAEEAADQLAAEGIDATVWDVRVVKPPDPAMLGDAIGHSAVVTVEDGIRVGGAGAFLVDAMAAMDANRHIPPVLVLGLPVAYIPQGKPAQILADLGLDGMGIAASVRDVLETSPAGARLDLD
jgi:1-deoxy-D-xylulose-5-phosphate synthase